MTMFERELKTSWPDQLRRLASPSGFLAILLFVAVALYLLPARLTDPARNAWGDLLRPAQAATGQAVDFSRDKLTRLKTALADGERLAEAERRVTELQEQNRRLASAFEAARVMQSESAASAAIGSPTEPLLRTDAIAARVLGHAAQSFLRGRELLDIGSRAGVSRGALVIDAGASDTDAKSMVDAGGDLGLQPGRMVLAGRRVWGKLASVGPRTSVVERITDRGYRDTIQLAHRDGGPGAAARLGPRGVLVGSGEALCRIELIEATEPVSAGDEVYTVGDGMLPAPLIYGRVVRVERPIGGPHWQIWMQPEVGADAPREVAVLRVELNPVRVADAGSNH